MYERHKALLLTNRLEITRDLRFRDIRRRLLDSGILTEENLAEIDRQQSREDEVKVLLDILPTKGPNAFAVFRDALKHRYPHLARILSDEGQGYRGSFEHWREGDVEESFEKVVADVSIRWDDLAGKLKLSRNEIKGLRTSQPDDDHRCREMLHRWMNKNGSDATLQDLKQALIDIGERLTAESL
ncbi:death domain-containing protein CRADD-like [Branchiostoma lanceolatum]|uniref:death domain-containing protein CRADD-like n=1 Tax=Branchiostoma lanceolatum TaxID=7740 RepID=UPI0034561729